MNSTFNSYTPGVMDLLPPDAREALVAAGRSIRLKAGQLVQSRGHRQADVGIILSGRLRMMTLGVDGSVMLTAIFGPGQQFNEVTLFANAARTHDAEAVEDAVVLTLTASEYADVARRHPAIVEAMLKSNVSRVHQLVEALNDLRALPKSVVLARVLLKNARHLAGDRPASSVDLAVTQEDIAMFLSVTRPYLNKTIGQLSELGLIEVFYRRIRVPDLAALDHWINTQLTYAPVEDGQV
jgi:CRP/FNR family cyclic AMP-dependent transcriptional regulator